MCEVHCVGVYHLVKLSEIILSRSNKKMYLFYRYYCDSSGPGKE